MSDTKQPESAFPSTFKSMSPEEGQVHRWGMTLRDYFAAKAMQGILFEGLNESETAKNAYAMADAMLKARDKC
jgi:hypothetical protein